MSAGYSDLRRWDASRVGAAGDCIKRSVTRIEGAADTMANQSFPTGWTGRGATASAITRNRLVHWLQIQGRIRSVFVNRVFAAETAVAKIRRDIETLDEEARTHGFRISDDGSISDEHDYGFPTPDDLVDWFQRRAKLDDLVDRRDAIVAAAAAVDQDLVAAIGQATDNEDPEDGITEPGPGVAEQWGEMSDDERRGGLRNIAADLAEQYGVPEYSITFGTLDPGTLGTHDPTTHEITISTDYLDDPVVLNTIVHEMMHAGHDVNLDDFPGLTPQEIEELRDNDDNYRSSSIDWEDYRYQPEEDITRSEADEWVRDLTPGELDDFR